MVASGAPSLTAGYSPVPHLRAESQIPPPLTTTSDVRALLVSLPPPRRIAKHSGDQPKTPWAALLPRQTLAPALVQPAPPYLPRKAARSASLRAAHASVAKTSAAGESRPPPTPSAPRSLRRTPPGSSATDAR